MPLTTRRARRALTSGLLALGMCAVGVLPAAAAPGPDATPGSTHPANAAVVTPGTGPVAVTVLVPIVVPPATAGLLTADELDRYTGPFGVLTRQLAAVEGTGATLAVDPMVLASIRVLGGAAPDAARDWLARLEALPNDVFTLAYADADPAVAVRSGSFDVLQPSGFGFALDPANFASDEPQPQPEPTPESTSPADPVSPPPTAEPDDDVLPPFPTTEQLLAWTTELQSIAWPHADTLLASDLALLGEAGFDAVVVESDAAGDPRAPLARFDGIDGVVVDSTLSALVGEAASALVETERTSRLQLLETALAAETSTSPGRGIVVATGRTWPYPVAALAETLAAIEASASARLVPLADILATEPAPATFTGSSEAGERDGVLAALDEPVAAELAFSSVLVDPAPLRDPRVLERIVLYSVGWSGDENGWTEAVTAFRERSEEIVGSVRIERGSDALLLARNTDLRVAVSNALPFPVTVRVNVEPSSPILQVQDRVEVTVEPESTGTAYVPVEAIANGEIRVTSELTSPTGVPLDRGFATVTVQAEWEGIGTLVIVVLLALVFAAGIVRIIVVRRRARRGSQLEAEAEAPDA